MLKLFSIQEWIIITIALLIWAVLLVYIQIQMNRYDIKFIHHEIPLTNSAHSALPKLDKI
jgi:type IV secretory pathway TrbD component